MKQLVIIAHPSSKGMARLLAEEYISAARESGSDVSVIDLYKEEPWNSRFLSFENNSEIGKTPDTIAAQEEIRTSDRVVLFFPIWWYDAPAIMKNFFDSVFSNGFAFIRNDKTYKPLLSGKEVMIFATSGGPAIVYHIDMFPFKKVWNFRFNLCGINPKIFIFGNTDHRSDVQKIADMNKVKAKAKM